MPDDNAERATSTEKLRRVVAAEREQRLAAAAPAEDKPVFRVTERSAKVAGPRWFVSGPGVDPDDPPRFETSEGGVLYLKGQGLADDQILLEPY